MRTFQSPLSCMLILTLALAAATVAGQGAPSPKAVPLFDSKTLDGWEGNLKIFRVEDGAIVAGTLDNLAKLRAWLLRVTRNAMVDQVVTSDSPVAAAGRAPP